MILKGLRCFTVVPRDINLICSLTLRVCQFARISKQFDKKHNIRAQLIIDASTARQTSTGKCEAQENVRRGRCSQPGRVPSANPLTRLRVSQMFLVFQNKKSLDQRLVSQKSRISRHSYVEVPMYFFVTLDKLPAEEKVNRGIFTLLISTLNQDVKLPVQRITK